MSAARDILLVSALALPFTAAKAQSDLCGGATLIACGAVVAGSTVPFTADVAPFCGTTDGTAGGVWFRFVGTGGSVTASLCGSGYDTKIRVYTGGCAGLVCVVGNDDFCGLQSQVTWLSTLAVNYYILVHGFGGGAGNYTLNLTCAAPPVPMCYSQTATPYLADPYAGTALALTDDVHSGVVNIGFSFCYNGTTYTQCVISSNNYVTFNLANAGTYSPWPTVPVPAVTPTQISNSILNPWQDIHPGIGGTVTYQTLGTAPYRRFVVSYLNVPMYSCTSQRYSSQTVLYESTNCIGSYILEKNICTAWNGGNAVHALHNNGGTSATVVPGRNNTQWLAAAQGMFFIPSCAPCSTATTAQCLSMLLPVELLRFHGRSEQGANILEWATASEENSDRFIVERSPDGIRFQAIAERDGAGTSSRLIEYAIRDDQPIPGMNFYRLRQVDLDGTEEISEVIALESSPEDLLRLFPNPGSGSIQYRLPEHSRLPVQLEVRDLSNRIAKLLVVGSPAGTLDLSGLVAGSYAVVIPGSGRATQLVIE